MANLPLVLNTYRDKIRPEKKRDLSNKEGKKGGYVACYPYNAELEAKDVILQTLARKPKKTNTETSGDESMAGEISEKRAPQSRNKGRGRGFTCIHVSSQS
jgi:hypothetical protein